MVREIDGAKYKSVAKKVIPMSTQDPGMGIPVYTDIQIEPLEELPEIPKRMEDLKFTKKLTKEQVSSIIVKIPVGFLTKTEAELLIHILFCYEWAIVFTDLECRTFSHKYYPDYVIRMVPHQPWQKKPIRLPQARCEEVVKIMKEQMRSGKYEPSSASYYLTFFAVEKKGGDLRVVHDLQPLNVVTVWDATLPPQVDNMIKSFSGQAVYGLFDLKSGYDSQILVPIS